MITFTKHESSSSGVRSFWVRILKDGSTVARTETYQNSSSCDNAVDIVRRNRVKYEVFNAQDGVRFRVKGLNGEIVFQSTDAYNSNLAAQMVVNAIKTGAAPAQYLSAA